MEGPKSAGLTKPTLERLTGATEVAYGPGHPCGPFLTAPVNPPPGHPALWDATTGRRRVQNEGRAGIRRRSSPRFPRRLRGAPSPHPSLNRLLPGFLTA